MRESVRPKVSFRLSDGRKYQWSGYFGCQLESFEYWPVKAGTQREFDMWDGDSVVRMRVFTCEYDGLFCWRVTWALEQPIDGLYQRVIEQFRTRLRKLI